MGACADWLVFAEAAKLAVHTHIKSASIVGGQSIDEQSLVLSKVRCRL
jgi:hypothetical protein